MEMNYQKKTLVIILYIMYNIKFIIKYNRFIYFKNNQKSGKAMDLENFQIISVIKIEKLMIQVLYMDFNGDILVLNIKICILIIRAKALINYKI